MAIQIPNPGTGNGATGDNEFVLWSKVKDNFSNTSHAASRLVGTSTGNVPEFDSNDGVSKRGYAGLRLSEVQETEERLARTGFYKMLSTDPMNPNGRTKASIKINYGADTTVNITLDLLTAEMHTAAFFQNDIRHTAWNKVYSSGNTTLDGNGALKPSSPVLRVFNDRIEGNHDGDAMAATYTKNGVGDYTITGTTGLRTDGWYVVTPNDMNGNPKVAITLDDADGVITLRSYVRIFDMSTFKFVPDLEQPLDIPDGRWIDLRFNDLPVEIEDDTQTED